MEYLMFKFKRELEVQGETIEHIVIAEDRAAAWMGIVKDLSAGSLLNTKSITLVSVSKFEE